ncbi:hypothetical protein IAR55_002174 [Kwoniella newhampshirensis]|uniref:Uncharacterized protein n=1 Tax=Kwoniella newhampshirensis TaxID=1651941 RepID=A0AAW0Z0A0_9TREE
MTSSTCSTDEPRTYSTSPLSLPKDLDDEMTYSNTSATSTSPEVVKEKKRKYSQGIFRWTQVMWESARQDIERRSSVSSTNSTSSSTDDHSETDENHEIRQSTNSDIGHDIGSVPAIH